MIERKKLYLDGLLGLNAHLLHCHLGWHLARQLDQIGPGRVNLRRQCRQLRRDALEFSLVAGRCAV